MRHGIKGRKLNRTSAHRKALLMNLSNSIIKYEQIKTTLPKAKELKAFVEKIITMGKKGDLAHRRQALSILQDQESVTKVFATLATRYKDRSGGYVRIMKCGFRTGDAAPMAIIEFVDKEEIIETKEEEKIKKKTKETVKKSTEKTKEDTKKDKKQETK